jgi:hypothetical protein
VIEYTDTTALPAAPAPAWKRHRVFIASIGVLILAAAIAIWATRAGVGDMTVHGTISLSALQYGDNTNPTAPADGDSCAGFEGYADIAPGLVITVEGAAGQSLGTGLLQAGVMQDVATVDGLRQGLCVLPFTAKVPTGEAQYAVSIPNRGSQLFTPAQLAAGVQLSINVG